MSSWLPEKNILLNSFWPHIRTYFFLVFTLKYSKNLFIFQFFKKTRSSVEQSYYTTQKLGINILG